MAKTVEFARKWKIRYWIIGGYSIPVFLTILSAGLVFWKLEVIDKTTNDLAVSGKIEAHFAELAFHTQTLFRTTRGYLLEKSTMSSNSYEEAKRELNSLAIALEQEIRNPQQQQAFNEIMALVEEVDQLNNRLIRLVDQGRVEEARQLWAQTNSRGQAEQVSQLLKEFKEREDQIFEEDLIRQHEALDNLGTLVIVTAVLSVIVAGIVGNWIIRSIAQQMSESANAIAASSNEISATIEQQERTATQQAASVNETTTTVDELEASFRQSAEQAESAAAAARHALELTEVGTAAVNENLARMMSLQEKVNAIAQQIMQLSDQAGQIGNISALVSDLANQTNMLALNAAVEAVRAGEQGKGFSVVAAEIRKLADQSGKSAEKINLLVKEVQRAVNSTVMVTDEGTQTVEKGVKISEKTSNAFAGVAESVNNVVLNNQQISLNIQQQANAIQQIAEAMNSINQGAKETAMGITQTRQGTQQLNKAALELKEIV
ncbi:MAG: methyl-accepting chemotaxis protein [Chroococcales cyanobacterium]